MKKLLIVFLVILGLVYGLFIFKNYYKSNYNVGDIVILTEESYDNIIYEAGDLYLLNNLFMTPAGEIIKVTLPFPYTNTLYLIKLIYTDDTRTQFYTFNEISVIIENKDISQKVEPINE